MNENITKIIINKKTLEIIIEEKEKKHEIKYLFY